MNNKYLFCYFTGNEPEKESINFALSEDGYNFKPLNDNKAVLFNELGTKGIRDPFILRDVNGGFYIIGTDMRSELGWASNHALCVWHSDDLVSWEQYPIIDMNEYLPSSVRTWAPEVFYDRAKEMYMIYWANAQHFEDTDEWTRTVMWYAYTKDFKSLETEPKILYAPPCGKDAIDADIIENGGTYYMYYKDENEKYICYVYSDKLEGPYNEPENKNITDFDEHTEGCCMYPLVGTDKWLMIMDSYTKGYYVMQETTDFTTFKRVDKEKYSLDFSPRHGSMLVISDEEYETLMNKWGNFMAFENGAVEFYDLKPTGEICDFDKNIPFDEYLYKEEIPDKVYDIRDFGAGEDADFLINTKAVNSAVDKAFENGGGTVLVPEGVYICSAVMLKSNVTLFVKGTLKSVDCESNKKTEIRLGGGETYYVHSSRRKGFIYADGAENITICGGGRIDGSGATYCQQAKKPEKLLPLKNFHLKTYIMEFRSRIRFEKENSERVNLIELCHCKGVDIHNIELYETACWTCNIFESSDIHIENVIINSNYHIANSDGFDISCCQNAVIRHCYIATGDDALCIKADGAENVDNILIEDCKVMSLANCFKIGTTVYRDVKNVTIRNCEFFMDGTTGGYSGISIQSDCGGKVQNILAENITMDGITSPFLIWLGDRRQLEPGEMKDITVRNITAKNVSLPSAVTGVVHKGRQYTAENITLENIDVTYRDSEEELYIRDGGVGYEAMEEYPEITRICSIYTNSHEESPYWELPVYGLYVRDVKNLTVNNFRCTPRSVNIRPGDNI